MVKYTLGCIGCGNMGGALVRAAARSIGGASIAVMDHHNEKTALLSEECGVVTASAEEIARSAKFVMLGVKPQNTEETLKPLLPVLQERRDVTLITMAAGLSTAAVQALFDVEMPVIRIMPNTPVLLGSGMILYTTAQVSDADERAFLDVFRAAGTLDPIEESLIDAGSALSGCGPAFVYLFAEALADGGVECGLPRDKAALYAAQTLRGAADMLLAYGHPGDLKDAVCSPGGTTIAGVHALESAGLRAAAMDAVTAAYRRTLELKK